jgi:hypothetical protein
VTVTGENASGEKYLTDGIFTTKEANSYREFTFDGSGKVELVFSEPKNVTAVMVYNSFYFDNAFMQVDEIVLHTTKKPEGFAGKFDGTVSVKNLRFNPFYYYLAQEEDEESFMRPGGSALYQFKEMPVTKITITVSKKLSTNSENKTIGISEITVLGK